MEQDLGSETQYNGCHYLQLCLPSDVNFWPIVRSPFSDACMRKRRGIPAGSPFLGWFILLASNLLYWCFIFYLEIKFTNVAYNKILLCLHIKIYPFVYIIYKKSKRIFCDNQLQTYFFVRYVHKHSKSLCALISPPGANIFLVYLFKMMKFVSCAATVEPYIFDLWRVFGNRPAQTIAFIFTCHYFNLFQLRRRFQDLFGKVYIHNVCYTLQIQLAIRQSNGLSFI